MDYIADFPIARELMPQRLLALLAPIGMSPEERVEVTSKFTFDQYGPNRESYSMTMAVVPDTVDPIPDLAEAAAHGVVAFSVPFDDEKGVVHDLTPSISGCDYIVASWGDGSFYTFSLAEKVWMTLGLTARCVGNEVQRLIYDSLREPEFGIADGEISGQYHWSPDRNISWKMSNAYLRKYLWLRAARGVRAFYYTALLEDRDELRVLMDGAQQSVIKTDWFELDIREHKNGLLIRVWATVVAVSSDLCTLPSADGLVWPDRPEPITASEADALVDGSSVYLDDRFLERYEQSSFYDTVPALIYGKWWCSPSYLGQWSFTECVRIGRNLIRVPLRELYKPKPDREIVHAHVFAVSTEIVSHLDLTQEHVVSKTNRLLNELLDLGDNLSKLGQAVGLQNDPVGLVGFSRAEIRANGWMAYPRLSRLAQVAPLQMTEQAFLARCKTLHEIWQTIPSGFLKGLLEKAGCPRKCVKELASLRRLQALLNIVEGLNGNAEAADAFANTVEPENWNARNSAVAALFLNNDLRIGDAHEVAGTSLDVLQKMGFDTAHLNDGYGLALDFVMDGVIQSFITLNDEIRRLVAR